MANAVAPDEVNDQQHQKRAANHHGSGDLQAKLQVVKIRNLTHDVRTQPANQLGGKHVHAYGSSMRATRHHVVQYGSDRPVIPGHEEDGNGESHKHSGFFFRLNRQ